MFQLDERLQRDTERVASFALCEVLLMNNAHYPWLILVPRKPDLSELHQLSQVDLTLFWQESMFVSRLLEVHYQAHKLNIAALGNAVRQLHIHHIVRFRDDAAWPNPVWGQVDTKAYDSDELDITVNSLKALLAAKSIERAG